MIDIPIIPPNLAGNVTSHDPSNQALLLKIPQGLEKLLPGTIVNALVIKPDAASNPLLRFTSPTLQNTELPVSTKLPLQQGAEVQLKILTNTLPGSAEAQTATRAGQPAQPQFQAQVITVDGKPLPSSSVAGFDTVKAILPNFPANTPATSTTAPASNATILNISGGTQVAATVITPEKGAEAFLPKPVTIPGYSTPTTQNSALPLQPNDTLKLHILSTDLAPQVAATPAGQPVGQSATPLPSQLSAYSKTSGEAPTLQQNIQSFAGRADAAAPLQQSSGVTPVTNNQSFTGIVVGTEKSGETVLQTPLGVIKLPAGLNLPQGTALRLEAISVEAAATKAAGAQVELSTPRSASQLIQQSFGELAAMLKSPEMATLSPQQVLPHTADKQFAAKLLWFISGVAGGNAAQWLGEPARKALEEAGHKNLLQKLEGAFQTLKGMYTEPNPQGWTAMPFPVWDGEKLQHGMFYLHRDPEADKEERRKKDARFMVEVSLEDTGDMQIDGLMHHTDSKVILELVIRTHAPLPDDMRSDILRIFEDTNAISGIDGSLQFLTMRDFPIHPMTTTDDDKGIIA